MATPEQLRRLRIVLAIRLPIGLSLLLGVLLLVAGTVGYWQAWMVITALLLSAGTVGIVMLRLDPDFLLHRLQFREREPVQKRIMGVSGVAFAAAMIVPGLDVRLGWSDVPDWVCVAALACFLASYGFTLWVFATNRYASRIIEVQQGQKVIDSGPYAVVRHPMYLGQIVLFPSFLLALGSWWAALLGSLIVVPLVLRIRNEELVLRRDLPGYTAYCQRTRYRLFPGIW